MINDNFFFFRLNRVRQNAQNYDSTPEYPLKTVSLFHYIDPQMNYINFAGSRLKTDV